MVQFEKWFTTDLMNTIGHVKDIGTLMFTGDNNSHKIGVMLLNNRVPVNVNGTVVGFVIRSDGSTVVQNGEKDGNKAWIILPEAAFAYQGRISIAIQIVNGQEKTVVLAVSANVKIASTDTVVDPGTIIPSVSELIASIEAAVESIPEDYSELNAEVAGLKSALFHIDESAFTIVAEPGEYIPMIFKSGDSVTVKTASGNAFAGTSAIGLYNINKTSIGSFNVSATYGVERTLNLNLSANAYYIKVIPGSGFEGETLYITNNSNHTLLEIKKLDNSLDNKIKYAVYATEEKSTDFTADHYVRLNVGVGNTVDMTDIGESAQYGYVVIPCKAGDIFMLSAKGGSVARAWGFTDSLYKLLSVASANSTESGSVLTASYDGYFICNHDVTKTYSLSTMQIFKAVRSSEASAIAISSVSDVLGYERINYFNRETIHEGKYISPKTGKLLNNSSWFTSDYIDITGINPLIVYGTTYICCYSAKDEDSFIDQTNDPNTTSEPKAQTLPTGTKYIRVSANNNYLNKTQVGKVVYKDDLIEYDKYVLNDLLVYSSQTIEKPIVVDANGSGDYTSFTLACKENYDNNRDIVVMPGTYNIVSEYTAIWGAEAVASMADADSETFDGWQYGVKMNGRKFTFQSGAKLVLDWTGHTVDGTHRFSALRVERNVEIIGLDLDCTATFYAIHDDYGNNNEPYTVTYRNCRVIGHSLSNVNCIGGGCKKWSRHILDNCYFDNNTTVSTAVRYHNTNAEGAVPEIYVSNCYFGTYFRANYYGSQTSKMRVYVNNCQAKKIYKGAEGSASVDNVELYKWCNTETEPEET